MTEKEQLTVITAALLHSMSYTSLSQKAIQDIVTQAEAVVTQINSRKDTHG
jgi:hypothetical protein